MAYKNISLKRNGTEKIFRDNIDHQFKKKIIIVNILN
jgi:hypothetical protein